MGKNASQRGEAIDLEHTVNELREELDTLKREREDDRSEILFDRLEKALALLPGGAA